MKDLLFQCFVKQSTVEAYCGVEVYIHVLLKTALDIDMRSYIQGPTPISPNKEHDVSLGNGRIWQEKDH